MTHPPPHSRLGKLKTELCRKGIHVASGVVPLSYAFCDHKPVFMVVLGAMLAGMLLVELLRRHPNPLGRLFEIWFGFMLRAKESERLLGATHYCLASLMCVWLLPRPAAVLGLLFLAVGDSAASLVGITWGRIRIGGKSLEGTVAFWIAASLVALAAHGGWPEHYPLVPGLIAAVVAALAELLLQRFDDNWTVPLAGGGVMAALMMVGG